MNRIFDLLPGDRVIVSGRVVSYEEIAGALDTRSSKISMTRHKSRKSGGAGKLMRQISLYIYAVRTGKWRTGAPIQGPVIEKLTALLITAAERGYELSPKVATALQDLPASICTKELNAAANAALMVNMGDAV